MSNENVREKNLRIGIGLAIFITLLGLAALIYGIMV